jgi:hypothetical protein
MMADGSGTHRGESETRKKNRIALTEYWESKGVKLGPLETIDDYVVVPGEPSDWLLFPLIEKIKKLNKGDICKRTEFKEDDIEEQWWMANR